MLACSHLVLATPDVPRITEFFRRAFELEPHFGNEQFVDFVLPSRFRVAFFLPVGVTRRSFRAEAERDGLSIGITVEDVHATHQRILELEQEFGCQVSGPPKEHPWGEASFLLTDPDGNRWEVTQAPAPDGLLVNR